MFVDNSPSEYKSHLKIGMHAGAGEASGSAQFLHEERFHNESGLIGALLSYGDPALYRSAAAICGPEHFCDNFHARLFAIIGRGIDAGLVSFPLTHWVISELRGDDTLNALKTQGSAIVARYVAHSFPAIGVEGAARQVKHAYLNGQLLTAVEQGETAEAEQIAAEMERLRKAHLSKDTGLTSLGMAANDVVTRVSDAFRDGAVQEDMAWPGSHRLAEVVGGWRRGRMYVIGGRPGSGKTTCGLSLLLRTAMRGHGVMFFELEMTAVELTEMALCDLAWTRRQRIEYRDLSRQSAATDPGFEQKILALADANNKLRSIPFVISDTAGLTIAEIRSQTLQYSQRLAVQGKRLDVVCIDHLNLVKATSNYAGNKVAETEEVSNALKALAKELQCAVVVLCQLNRGVEGREDKRPGLADLRWTGAIEQDADVVMFVYREAYYLSKPVDDPVQEIVRHDRLREVESRLEIIVAKHRGGPTAVMEFFCDMGCGVVRDVERQT